LQKHSHLEQSLFSRLIRLGTPTIKLDAQGRSRPSIADLFRWRYHKLEDLPNVMSHEYFYSNIGFVYDYQFINVPDFQGQGEWRPKPHYYQNLAEAEYLVSVYQYMRLLGYPAWKITLLTTYKGQKSLLREIIDKRCSSNPLFGRPYKVTTVDKYQGQQNDYVLISMVKTVKIGHISDVRRLTVAMSRARLGIYIFGRIRLISNCYDIRPSLQLLMGRPTLLMLLPNVIWKQNSRKKPLNYATVSDPTEMAYLVASLARECAIEKPNIHLI